MFTRLNVWLAWIVVTAAVIFGVKDVPRLPGHGAYLFWASPCALAVYAIIITVKGRSCPFSKRANTVAFIAMLAVMSMLVAVNLGLAR